MHRRLGAGLGLLMVISGLVAVAPAAHADPPGERHDLYVGWGEPQRALITDRRFVGSWIWVVTGDPAPGEAHPGVETTWVITDHDGDTALGPVTVDEAVRTMFSVGLNASGEDSSGPLPPGEYTLEVTKTDLNSGATNSGSMPLTFVEDPPTQAAPTATDVVNVMHGNDATWEVPALLRRFDAPPATLVVTTPNGERVLRRPIRVTWGGPVVPIGPSPVPMGTSYTLEWDGSDSHGLPVRAGHYRADAVVPDGYGRPMTIHLGTVRLYREDRRVVRVSRAFTRPRAVAPGARVTVRVPVGIVPDDARLDWMWALARLRAPSRVSATGRTTFSVRLVGTKAGVSRSFNDTHSLYTAQRYWTPPRPVSGDPTGVLEVTVSNHSSTPLRINAVRAQMAWWHWTL